MIHDTKTVFEHWTDEELQAVTDQPEAAEAGMLDGVRREIERRAGEHEKSKKAREAYAEAKRKIEDHKKEETRQKEKERLRGQMFSPAELSPQVQQRLAITLDNLSRAYYRYGGHREAFVLDVLVMSIRDCRLSELVHLLRNTDFAKNWSMTHPDDPNVVVYFNDVFPAEKCGKAAV